jgi:hypothetical protein
MDNCIFERHELKYLVTDCQRRILEQTLQERMVPDEHGESTVCNIYFDTPDFYLVRRSLEKPVYKEKLRVRSYGPVTSDRPVFLELKKKYKGVVYKRRISLEEQAAMDFLCRKTPLPEQSQIGHEIEYFLEFYRDLGPAVHLSYDRTAFFSKENQDLRVTFDKNIRWRTKELSLTRQPGGEQILQPRQSLMEIKASSAVPLWLVHLLSGNQIYQSSFSKYGRAYCAMMRENFDETRGVSCA